jgi:hypothetical protein
MQTELIVTLEPFLLAMATGALMVLFGLRLALGQRL